MKSIGLIGVGTVGGTLKVWLEENSNSKPKIYDPRLGYEDDISDCELVFIAVPVPNKSFIQDLSLIKESIERCNVDALIVIRSTIVPGTTDKLAKEYDRSIYVMPEFLTERRAQDDFNKHHIIIGYPNNASEKDNLKLAKIMGDLFFNKHITVNKAVECELGKYGHNCFGAMKVTYFNIIKDLCEKEGSDYERVMQTVLSTGFINSEHTKVPGPDGKKGYGGSCFPVNIESMIGYTKNHASVAFFKDIFCLNRLFRGDKTLNE